ncbi:MAG: hypothetical protein LUO80_02835, partial [Methylococcaceae bacterium]|nr:hypothetical protein [Methylococcaceae bacterium]
HRPNALAICGVGTVAMESTGGYSTPYYEPLGRRGFRVLLVKAGTSRTSRAGCVQTWASATL